MIAFFNQLKRARLFGHPIHSMLVHFPSALFPMSLIFDVIAFWFQNTCFACAAFYSIAAGIILGFIAAIFGSMDYARLSPSHLAWNKASLHGLLNITWLIIFSIILGLKLKSYPIIPITTPIELIISTITVAGLIFSNFLGGELIFHYKLGFEEQK